MREVRHAGGPPERHVRLTSGGPSVLPSLYFTNTIVLLAEVPAAFTRQ